MQLEIERPLVCFDVETTGPNVETDRVIQLGVIKWYPGGEQTEWDTLLNPGVPIPPEITDIHGIKDEDVSAAPMFPQIAGKLVQGFLGCDFLGYNVKFDVAMIRAELRRLHGAPDPFDGARLLDAYRVFTFHEPRTLSAAVKFYLNEELEGAHDAMADTRATWRVFEAQLVKYDLPKRINALLELVNPPNPNHVDSEGKMVWRHGKACLGFGKFKGTPLDAIPKDYLNWIMTNDFPKEVKKIISDALVGVFPEKS